MEGVEAACLAAFPSQPCLPAVASLKEEHDCYATICSRRQSGRRRRSGRRTASRFAKTMAGLRHVAPVAALSSKCTAANVPSAPPLPPLLQARPMPDFARPVFSPDKRKVGSEQDIRCMQCMNQCPAPYLE